MEQVPLKPRKKIVFNREELLNLDKNELVDKILQLEAHNAQLKNIISKNLSSDSVSEQERKKKFDFSKCHYRKVLLRIMYFGWDYQGLAVQEDTNQTIEHHLFHALTKSCLIESRETSQYHRCGRTDKGVSAFGQVISINLRSKFPPPAQKQPTSVNAELPYCKILNRLLPERIRALCWMPVPEDRPNYSARFDCKKRQYKYYFPRSNLNIPAMRVACSHLIGSHDYRHLCKMDVGNGVTQFRREIVRADVLPVGEETDDPRCMFHVALEGGAFLWHQVRCALAVLLLVGGGREEPAVVRELLDVEQHPRKPQYSMALDVPLNLFHCSYDLEENNEWVYDIDELRTVISHFQKEWTLQNIKSTMIKDSLEELEATYSKLSKEIDNNSEGKVLSYTDCLTQGVKPKVYTPLMKRQTCSSLEERIEHYKKKRRIENVSANTKQEETPNHVGI